MIKIIIYLIILFNSCTSVWAQYVKTVGNYIVIDCTAMPYQSKRVEAVKTHNEKSLDNRVPALLAIAPKDALTTSSIWMDAKNACATYVGPNGGEAGKWRLPTQREAIRMNILKSKLEATRGFTKFTIIANTEVMYWTCTEYSSMSQHVWGIRFDEYGITTPNPDGYIYNYGYARCVRDF